MRKLPQPAVAPIGQLSHSFRLSDLPEPGRAARRFMAGITRHWLTSDQSYAAELVTSELVTNAFRHGKSPIDLSLHVDNEERLVVSVSDAEPTSPTHRLPCENGGFGLSVVTAYADIIVTPTETGKAVSARLKSEFCGHFSTCMHLDPALNDTK